MTATDIISSLRQVFSTLNELQRVESGEIELSKTQESPPAKEETPQTLTPKNSIQEEEIICLECGAGMRLLTQTDDRRQGCVPMRFGPALFPGLLACFAPVLSAAQDLKVEVIGKRVPPYEIVCQHCTLRGIRIFLRPLTGAHRSGSVIKRFK